MTDEQILELKLSPEDIKLTEKFYAAKNSKIITYLYDEEWESFTIEEFIRIVILMIKIREISND